MDFKAKEYETRKAIEKRPTVYDMPLLNALLFSVICFSSMFILFAGFSTYTLGSIMAINLISYGVLRFVSERQLVQIKKSMNKERIVIKVNSKTF